MKIFHHLYENKIYTSKSYLIIILIFALLGWSFQSKLSSTEAKIDRQEAIVAFKLLNQIRTEPEKYIDSFRFLKNAVINKKTLVWNDTLAKIAEQKALDMARRNYFGHVNPDGVGMNYLIQRAGYKLNPKWYENKSENFFESISANSKGGENGIKQLIIDENVPSKGHRKHLLGMGKWESSLVDIGVGYVTRESGSQYKTYLVVLIAKHDW